MPARRPTGTVAERLTRLVVLAVGAAAIVVTGVYLIVKAGGLGGATCANQISSAQSGVLIGSCVAMFAVGRWLAAHRHEDRDPHQPGGAKDLVNRRYEPPEKMPDRRPRVVRRTWTFLKSGDATGPGAQRRGALLAHVALVFVFTCTVLALGYETVAVWSGNPWKLDPITHFVRCARNADFGFTMLAADTVSLLAGHWLWFSRR